MRTGGATLITVSKMTTITSPTLPHPPVTGNRSTWHSSKMTTITSPTFPHPPVTGNRSTWHSPVPYLFGGLAVMLGLIAFALLLLACSYLNLSRRSPTGTNSANVNTTAAAADGDEKGGNTSKGLPVYEEKIVVIMAGDVMPTFLATPMFSKASSFGNGDGKREKEEREKGEITKNPKQEMGSDHYITMARLDDREAHENQEQTQ